MDARVWRWTGTFVVALALAAGTLSAMGQAWKGMGRMAGKVVDEDGKPIEGVVVQAFLPVADARVEAKTNKKGEWSIGGIARGDWQIEFAKDGYESFQATVSIAELTRLPPMNVTLKKAAPVVDPNVEIREGFEKAAALMQQKQFGAARAIYEDLLGRFPQVHQLHPLIARTYYGEGQLDKSIEHLRLALERDAQNVEVRLLLGNVLIEKGDADAGREMIASVADAQIKDPTTLLNVAIGLINQGKGAEAATYLEKNVALFPDYPDSYYYRALTHLQLGNTGKAKADFAQFLKMAPDAPEAPMARKALEQIK